ncbi:hypothetical protein KW797_00425 [Candidatus Parcubacteria bacterium]|nr:hypothetical protein [Candidatus Parcubacteria bacterium]
MVSVAIEPLGTITLVTTTWTNSTTHVRVDSHSQLQIFLDYNPDASEVAGSGECEVQLLYSAEPADTDQTSGGSGNFTWRGYCEEVDQGDGSSKFQVRTWRILANATNLFDRDPCFSRPLAGKVVKIRAREVGITTNGTLIASLGAQRI